MGEVDAHRHRPVDELCWLPGWTPVDEVWQRESIVRITSQDKWILDSAYASWLDLVLARTELIVALDYPRWFSLQRLVRRTAAAVTKRPRCNGNTETFRRMMGEDSIVRWHFRSFGRKRDRIRHWAAAPSGPPVLRVRSQRELDAWIAGLGS